MRLRGLPLAQLGAGIGLALGQAIPSHHRAAASAAAAARLVASMGHSKGRLILAERGLELLHDRLRITAGLLDVVGPGVCQRLGGLAPLGKLLAVEIE